MIDPEELKKHGIDYEAGLSRFMDDKGFYEAVLCAFLEEDTLERAKAAFEADDRDALMRAVHEAKGSGGNAGITDVYTEASALVALLRSGSYTDGDLYTCYRKFEEAMLFARDGIRSAIKN